MFRNDFDLIEKSNQLQVEFRNTFDVIVKCLKRTFTFNFPKVYRIFPNTRKLFFFFFTYKVLPLNRTMF